MARIAGVNIPSNKRIDIALTSIFGIGHKLAGDICKKVGVDASTRVHKINDSEFIKIREVIDADYNVEGDLRREVSTNIKLKMDIASYQGLRHRRKLPVRGQRTSTNARTRKGKAVAIAGKKK